MFTSFQVSVSQLWELSPSHFSQIWLSAWFLLWEMFLYVLLFPFLFSYAAGTASFCHDTHTCKLIIQTLTHPHTHFLCLTYKEWHYDNQHYLFEISNSAHQWCFMYLDTPAWHVKTVLAFSSELMKSNSRNITHNTSHSL